MLQNQHNIIITVIEEKNISKRSPKKIIVTIIACCSNSKTNTIFYSQIQIKPLCAVYKNFSIETIGEKLCTQQSRYSR